MLPYIKVDVDRIRQYQQDVQCIQNNVNSISIKFNNVIYQLDTRVRGSNGIDAKLQNIQSSLYSQSVVLKRTGTFLGNAAVIYSYAESPQGAPDFKFEYTKEEENEIIALAAKELGIRESDIQENINQGLSNFSDIVEFLEGKAEKTNKFVKSISNTVKNVTGAGSVLFKVNDEGYVIVSQFTRSGLLNKLVKKFNDGTGLGTRYRVDTLMDTPIVGTVYKVGEFANKVEGVVDTVTAITTGVTHGIEAGQKIGDIWTNDSLSIKEKTIDTAAVVITSGIATALDVGAPFVGSAVQKSVSAVVGGALSTVFPVGGAVIGMAVGYVSGKIVEKGMELMADVITSEAVVNQVSDSIEKVGDAVASGVASVSNAGKKLMESKNAGEAVSNAVKLVGAAAVAGVQVASTAVVEGIKTAATVVAETAKAAVNKVVEGAKSAAKAVKKFFKKW